MIINELKCVGTFLKAISYVSLPAIPHVSDKIETSKYFVQKVIDVHKL